MRLLAHQQFSDQILGNIRSSINSEIVPFCRKKILRMAGGNRASVLMGNLCLLQEKKLTKSALCYCWVPLRKKINIGKTLPKTDCIIQFRAFVKSVLRKLNVGRNKR